MNGQMHIPDTVPPGEEFTLAIEQETRLLPGSISMPGRTKPSLATVGIEL